MTTTHTPVPLSPFQQRLKNFCIWIETLFECRLARPAFAVRMAIAVAVLGGMVYVQKAWLADSFWLVRLGAWLLLAWAAFWGILQIVRRLHDLGRSGGLFWAMAVPFWALWKMTGLFPNLWFVWVVICAWPILLALRLFFQPGVEGAGGYHGR